MALYEHVFLTRQDAAPAQVDALTEQYKALIAANGGKVTKTEYWGLKTMAYKASDAVRVAPLLLARAPARRVAVGDESGGSVWDLSLTAIGVVTMLAIVGSIAVGFVLVGRSRRKRAAGAAGLDAALAEVEPFSVAESLARVAADEADRGDDASAGDKA